MAFGIRHVNLWIYTHAASSAIEVPSVRIATLCIDGFPGSTRMVRHRLTACGDSIELDCADLPISLIETRPAIARQVLVDVHRRLGLRAPTGSASLAAAWCARHRLMMA